MMLMNSWSPVVKFARDTGDLPFLSIPDIKLLALAFELEKRIRGTEHLCLTPNAIVMTKEKCRLR